MSRRRIKQPLAVSQRR